MVVAGIGGVCPCLRWEELSSGGRAFVPYNRGEQEEYCDQSRFPEQKRKITNISRIYDYLTMNSALDAHRCRCSTGRCLIPKTCSSAPQTLYVTSTAFFNAIKIPVATRQHNSLTKRDLIIIVLPGATPVKRGFFSMPGILDG